MKKRTKSIELLRLEGIWDESYQKMTNKKAINSPTEPVVLDTVENCYLL